MSDIILPDTYFHNLACGNCNVSCGLKIPLGMTVEKYIQSHTCGNCGCSLGYKQMVQPYNYPQGIPPVLYLPYSLLRRE